MDSIAESRAHGSDPGLTRGVAEKASPAICYHAGSRIPPPDARTPIPYEIDRDFPDSAAWDRYVEAHPEARFCHLSAYRCLSKVYGYRPWPMAFLEDSRIVGVLPAFEARSLLFGRRLVSQPFTEYGGMLLDADLSGEQVAEIFEHVRDFVRSRGLSCIDMHGRQGVPQDAATALMLRSNDQQQAELALDLPLEELYESRVTYQARKAVQKARRSNLTSRKAATKRASSPTFSRTISIPCAA